MTAEYSSIVTTSSKCFKCGADDHFKKDCPKLKENKENDDGKGSGGDKGDSGDKKKNPRYIPPKDGEPHTKTINGEEGKYCKKYCK